MVFPQICIALGFEDVEALLSHARSEYEAGERFLEFRLDYLASPERGVQAIKKFLARHPDCMILGTCRRRQNHGRFHGSIEEQVRVLEAAREMPGRRPSTWKSKARRIASNGSLDCALARLS